MQKIIILVAILSIVAVASVFFFWKSSPQPGQSVASGRKFAPVQRQQKDREQFPYRPQKDVDSTDHDQSFDEDKRRFTDSFYENARLDDEFGFESDSLYRELDSLDEFSDTWQHEQYKYLYDEFAQEELQREYEQTLMYEYALWEMQMLDEIYADPGVKSFREADITSRKAEREGKSVDKRELDKLPKDRKEILDDLADLSSKFSKKDKGDHTPTVARLNEATKDKSTQELGNVRDKLASPVAQREKGTRSKFIKDRVNKVKSLAAEIKNETTLFQATKNEKKFYLFGVKPGVSLENALPQSLEKRVLGSTILITTDKDFEITHLFKDESVHVVKASQMSTSYLADRIDPQSTDKVLVAVDVDMLLSERGLLRTLLDEGYRVKRYDLKGNSVSYTPLKARK